MAVLSWVAILGLATNSACGAAVPGSEFAKRLAAIAIHESAGGDPFVIGVNEDGVRGLPAAMIRSASAQAASVKARSLIIQGRSVDLGLMGINNAQMARHGLTVESAFDPCASMKAGAGHFADDVRAATIFDLAHHRYNTGSFERGAAYAASIERIVARVPALQPSLPIALTSKPSVSPFLHPAPGRALTFNYKQESTP